VLSRVALKSKGKLAWWAGNSGGLVVVGGRLCLYLYNLGASRVLKDLQRPTGSGHGILVASAPSAHLFFSADNFCAFVAELYDALFFGVVFSTQRSGLSLTLHPCVLSALFSPDSRRRPSNCGAIRMVLANWFTVLKRTSSGQCSEFYRMYDMEDRQ